MRKDYSPKMRHTRIHKEASSKMWEYGNWKVAPLLDIHRENMVIEFVRRKFPDAIWVAIDSLDNGYQPDFGDNELYRTPSLADDIENET